MEVTHTQTGVSSQAVTNSSGGFRFASLGIGSYDIRVTCSGFKAWNQRGVLLETDRALRIDAALEIGAEQESVAVSAEAPLLEKESRSSRRRSRATW